MYKIVNSHSWFFILVERTTPRHALALESNTHKIWHLLDPNLPAFRFSTHNMHTINTYLYHVWYLSASRRAEYRYRGEEEIKKSESNSKPNVEKRRTEYQKFIALDDFKMKRVRARFNRRITNIFTVRAVNIIVYIMDYIMENIRKWE